MKHPELSNGEYLEAVLTNRANAPQYVLLPHEQAGVDKAHQDKLTAFGKIIEEKINVTGGDDWHDGAFRATDNEAKIISKSMAAISPYLGAVVVSYPEASEARATLGSRATITQNGFTFPVDIVGFRTAYPADVIDPDSQEEVTAVSPESPLGQALIGRVKGDEASYMNGDRSLKVTIDRINQTAVREYFMETAGVSLEITDIIR